MLNPPSPLLATTARPGAERGHSHPARQAISDRGKPVVGHEVAVGLLGIVTSSEVVDASVASGNQ
jgi:hypothetical protein